MEAEETTDGRQTRPAAEPKVPAWLRAALPALAAVAPPLAARIGERLFLTPPRHPAPERERAALATAVPFPVPFRGGRLRAWRWGGPGAPVLLVHGWGGRAGQMAAFAPPLLEAGLSARALDRPRPRGRPRARGGRVRRSFGRAPGLPAPVRSGARLVGGDAGRGRPPARGPLRPLRGVRRAQRDRRHDAAASRRPRPAGRRGGLGAGGSDRPRVAGGRARLHGRPGPPPHPARS